MKVLSHFRQQLLPIFIFLLLCPNIANGGTLFINGTWQFSDSENGADNFRQIYGASYNGRTFITDLIQLSGSIRYNRIIFDDANAQDTVGASLGLTNFNDIYRFTINGSYSIINSQDGNRLDNGDWNSLLASNWGDDNLWPSLAVYYGQSSKSGDNTFDSKLNRAGALTSWNYWQWLKLTYNLNWSENRSDNISRKKSSSVS